MLLFLGFQTFNRLVIFAGSWVFMAVTAGEISPEMIINHVNTVTRSPHGQRGDGLTHLLSESK